MIAFIRSVRWGRIGMLACAAAGLVWVLCRVPHALEALLFGLMIGTIMGGRR